MRKDDVKSKLTELNKEVAKMTKILNKGEQRFSNNFLLKTRRLKGCSKAGEESDLS